MPKNAKVRKAVEKIRAVLAAETAPARMSKSDYLEVLEEMSADLEGSMEAVKAELLDERGGDE